MHYDSSLTFLDIPYNPLPANSPEAKQYAGDKPVQGSTYAASSKKAQFVQREADPDIGKMKKPRLVSAVCERVGKEVGDIAKKGWLPLTLGGDHSLVSSACFVRSVSAEGLRLTCTGNGHDSGHKDQVPGCLCHLGRSFLRLVLPLMMLTIPRSTRTQTSTRQRRLTRVIYTDAPCPSC